MDRPIFIDNVLGLQHASMRQILEIVKRTYCGTFALQYMHISDPEQSAWLKERIEGYGKEIAFTREGRKAILNKLVEAEGYEKFLHVKYMGTKRFGLDGGESLIPAMEQIIKRGGALGVKEIVIGMPHRGRLNILANVMQKPYRAIFNEFQGGSFKPEDVDGSGDVKYHLGASSDRTFDGNTVHLSLTANPSHLEAVNPVVLGKVRAKQEQLGDKTRARGAADPAARRRGLCGPGRRGGMLRPVGPRRPPHRRHDPHRGEQPDRLHHRPVLQPLFPLPHRHRPDGRGADLPRQRRRPRGGRPRRPRGDRVPPEVPQGRGHRHLLLPPLRPQRGGRTDVHKPRDVHPHPQAEDHAATLHRASGEGRPDPRGRDRGHEGRLPGQAERGVRGRQGLQAQQGRLAGRALEEPRPQGSRELPARRDRHQARDAGRGRHRPHPRARGVRTAQDRRAPARGQAPDVRDRQGLRLGHGRGARLRQPA